MVVVLAWCLVAGSLVLAAWSLLAAVRAQRPSGAQLIGLAVLEVLLVVQAAMALVLIARGDEPAGGAATFVGYLLTSVLLLPAGTAWGIADRSRWGNGVVAIACAAEAVVLLRLLDVWA